MAIESRRMDTAQVQAFLEEPRHAIAAVLRADGVPQLSPVWFLYQADRLYFSVFQRSAKFRNLHRDPRISLCIDAAHPDARAVSITGTAELITEETPERADIEWRIIRRYHASDADARRYEASIVGDDPGALIAVRPERIIGWDFN